MRGLPKPLKNLLKRRQTIEPTIGQMKTDDMLARNWLKGSPSDAIHAVLCGAGHKLRLFLAHLRVLLSAFIALIVVGADRRRVASVGAHRAGVGQRTSSSGRTQ